METSDTEGTLRYRFQQRLKKIKSRLKIWNKSVFGNIHQAKKDLEKRMANIQQEIILNGRSNKLIEEKIIQQELEDVDIFTG